MYYIISNITTNIPFLKQNYLRLSIKSIYIKYLH